MKKVMISLILGVMVGVVGLAVPVEAARLDEIQAEINAVNEKIKEYEREAGRLAAEAQTLAGEIARLRAEQNELAAQIELSQLEHDKLVAEIAATEKRIADNNELLGNIIAEYYFSDQVPLIERLVSSENLAVFIDEEAKLSSMGDNFAAIVKENEVLRAELVEQKEAVAAVIEQQKAQKAMVAALEAEQQRIWAETKGEEANYQKMRGEAAAQRAALEAEQQRIIDEINAGNGGNISGYRLQRRNYSGNLGCNSSMYTWSNTLWDRTYGCAYGLDARVDPWQLYNRECVSYVAHRLYYGYGRYVVGFNGQGNANRWPTTAVARMGAVRVWADVQVGDVAVVIGGLPLGHVMIVEAVYGDGWVRISEFNWVSGMYSEADVLVGSVDGGFLRFRGR
jgi:peptidoglycan hydrolase CwlO-like protein